MPLSQHQIVECCADHEYGHECYQCRHYELNQLIRPITTKNAMNDQVSALFFSTLLNCAVNSLSDIISRVSLCIPLQLYRHNVLLAVHFYCGPYAPTTLP